MGMIDPFVRELEHECSVTRRLLERVPDGQFGWKPHEKSMSLGQLASHLVEGLGWTGPSMELDEFVMDPTQYQPYMAANQAELLAAFDDAVRSAVAVMTGYPDERMMVTWQMKTPDGTVLLAMPRVAVVRGFLLNHHIHHRGQLTVYLRMLDVPLPQVYGPSADDTRMGATA